MTLLDTRWFSASRNGLLIKAWESEDFGVVYEPTCGCTHMLDSESIAVLSAVESISGATTSEISVYLTETFNVDDALQLPSFIESTLHKLQDAGLVTVAACETA